MSNQNNNTLSFGKGIADGIPIMLGYLSVSFSFGLMAVGSGLPSLISVLISFTNLTSAGQVAGVAVIAAGGAFAEMFLTELIINIRYALMGIALSQKLNSEFGFFRRLFYSFFITDEIFAVSVSQKEEVNPRYMAGLVLTPVLGWNVGTLLGAVAGNLLPTSVAKALTLAIYAMFVAIVVPPAREHKGVLFVALLSALISSALKYIPIFSFITQGFAIIICAVVASVVAALLFPVEND